MKLNIGLSVVCLTGALLAGPAKLSKFSEPTVPPGWHRVTMQWHYYSGWETNGISFNVREFPDNDNKRDLCSCKIITNVHALSAEFFAHPGLWRGITATNLYSGVESGEGIAPVGQVIHEGTAR